MEIDLWPLDFTYSISEDEVRLWGIDGEGRRVVVLDQGFHQYFFLIPEPGAESGELINHLKSRAGSEVLSLETQEKKLFGKPTEVIRVTCSNHKFLQSIARRLRKTKGVKRVIEDDIRYTTRYLIDNDVLPCTWHTIDAKEVENRWGYAVGAVYEALERPIRTERVEIPQLRTLSFAIEYYAPMGVSSKEAFVAVISAKTEEGGTAQFMAEDGDDHGAIAKFATFVMEEDPDIVVGYGSNFFDWKVLLDRASANGMKIPIGRDRSKPHRSVYGHISIAGRANVDLLNYAERAPDIKLKDLIHVASFYGLDRARDVAQVSSIDVPRLWRENREELLRFSRHKVELIHELSLKLLPFFIQLSWVVGLPLDQVVAAAVGFRVERNLMRHAHMENELIPKRMKRPFLPPYKGALVLAPKPGVHRDIAIMDFSSMYPSLMIKYNISPDTLVPSDARVPEDQVNLVAELNQRFFKSPEGFYKKLLARLIELRRAIKTRMKKLPPDSEMYMLLDQRQKAIKIVTNATYGYMGWVGARWYAREVAEATAALGRETIERAISEAKRIGLGVLYADTDGLMVRNEPEKIEEFQSLIEREIGLRIQPHKFYDYVLFTKAKKKYAGLEPSGEIDIVGFESIRGDWAMVAREAEEEIIRILLKERSIEKARSYVEKIIERIRSKRVPYDKFIIWKTLTKPIAEYKARAPHVAAAKRLFDAGGKLEAGDKIGFVVTRGEGKLYERAMPYALASRDQIDLDYYVNNQVLPLVDRCFEALG